MSERYAARGDGLHLGHDIVHLVGAACRDGADFHRRVKQAGGADDLFGEDAAGALQLPRAGRGGDMHRLRAHGVPFLEFQRPVVHAGGQAEAIFGERRLAAEVTFEHGADLGDGLVALIGEDEGVVGEVFEHGRRRLTGLPAGEVAGIVLDAVAAARGGQHLDVILHALFDALGLQQFPVLLEVRDGGFQLRLDLLDGLVERRARRHIVRVGVDLDGGQVLDLRPVSGSNSVMLPARRRRRRASRRGPHSGRGRCPSRVARMRNVPRTKLMSLRLYWFATRRSATARGSMRWPSSSLNVIEV
jgi:hypothetical protein